MPAFGCHEALWCEPCLQLAKCFLHIRVVCFLVLLQGSQQARKQVLLNHVTYVLVFAVCWAFPIIHRLNSRTLANTGLEMLDSIGITTPVRRF
jgi:hypothetical protein